MSGRWTIQRLTGRVLARIPAAVGLVGLLLSLTVGTTLAQNDSPGFGIARTNYGDVIGDSRGFTLYTSQGDDPRVSNCYETCAREYPPMIVTRVPQGSGDRMKPGMIARADGTLQATLDGWPVYYFSADTEPGGMAGHGRGGFWLISISPDSCTTCVD